MDIRMKVWNRIRDIRKEKNISQEQLGFQSNLHRTYLSSTERWLKNISIVNLEKISTALWVDIKDLFI